MYTPGPWHYTPTTLGHPDNRINPIVGADQERTGGVAYVARVGWLGSTMPGMSSLTPKTFEEAEANANLIAAAPQLLEALIECEMHVSALSALNPPHSVNMDAARAAAATARAAIEEAAAR